MTAFELAYSIVETIDRQLAAGHYRHHTGQICLTLYEVVNLLEADLRATEYPCKIECAPRGIEAERRQAVVRPWSPVLVGPARDFPG